MFLQRLSLVNYKNFDSQEFEFDRKINCVVGDNGVGKTNVMDAIYHLCFGKSYFNPVSSQNIKHGEEFFVIEGLFNLKEREEKVVCSLKKGLAKVIKRNDKAYERISDHIGLLPLVIISPADRDLIIEGSDARRKFMDGVISQSDKTYLRSLLNYKKVLSQRNALLKYFALNNVFDSDSIAVYNEQLHTYGSKIYESRLSFMEALVPIFQEKYQIISGANEVVDLEYQSGLKERPLIELLEDSLQKDRMLQHTSVGIHRDDLLFKIASYPVKKFGSQGQQKSFLIALKLAQFDFIKKQSGITPILILDDIFDKLDENRVAHIVKMVDDDHFGQIFLSDTHAERTENIIAQIHQTYKIYTL
ncbi:MAG: DNA replication/repair protein RecF [Flavobacteriaceae bacterium]